MTVHKAKGLEFPVVILADMTAKLRSDRADRLIDREQQRLLSAARALDADRAGDARGARDRARRSGRRPRRLRRGDARARSAGRAGRRRRDVGRRLDESAERRDLSRACRAPRRRRRRRDVRRSRRTRCGGGRTTSRRRRRRSARASTCSAADEPYPVVWWDPHALDLGVEPAIGIRRESLIVKDVPDAVVAEGCASTSSGERCARRRSRKARCASLSGADGDRMGSGRHGRRRFEPTRASGARAASVQRGLFDEERRAARRRRSLRRHPIQVSAT